jgi:hypothetical protein
VQGHFLTQQQHPQEMVQNDLTWKEPYEQNLQPSQMGQMEPQHYDASMEGWSSTVNSCFEEKRMVPQH